MADIRDTLRQLAIQIRDEHNMGANTAKRVGSLLLAIVDAGVDIDALRKYFLSKEQDDEAAGLIKFLQGIISLGDIVAKSGITVGENGSGISVLPDGKSQAVVDYLYVKVKAIFDELEVKKKTYVGGEQILSPAGMKCIRVEERTDAYRCYFKAEEDGIEIENQFTPGTLAITQECNIKTGVSHHVGNRYYWRLVTAKGLDYIDLSKTKCDPNIKNDIPAAGDDIVALGHETDITRQGAIVLSSVNEVAPAIIMYQGINDFTLTGKEVIGFDFDKATGKARMRVYGDAYIGAKDRSSYIEHTQEGGVDIKGRFHIAKGSTGWKNMDGLPEEIQEAISIADEAKKTSDTNASFIKGISSELENIKNQADGAIETWFYDPEPSLENEPAVNWKTADDKNVHLGDLYYSAEGKPYRFQLKDGIYSWIVITDTDVTKALATAKNAQDTADNKRRIFISQPTAESVYDIGDLWTNATYGTTYTNDLLRCNTAKISGEAFRINHWTLASKYTDDTVANEAKDRLSIWAEDGAISPTEKISLKQELKNLSAEYDSILLDCSKYDISSSVQVRKDYETAFSSYKAELEYHSTTEPENIPVREAFSSSQSAYYSFRTAIRSEITTRSKGYADGLISGMEIGKNNLLRNSGFTGDYNSAKLEDGTALKASTELYSEALKYWTSVNAVVNSDISSASGCSVTLANGSLRQTLYYQLIPGEHYVLSFKAKGISALVSVGGFSESLDLTPDYQKYVYKFKSSESSDFSLQGTNIVCELQLERGTVASEWGMSALDNNSMEAKYEALRYMTDVIRDGSVDLIGGLVLAAMLQLGNYADGRMKEVTAGVSGVYSTDDDVAFWSGGTLEQAIRSVMMFKGNPNYRPSEAELKTIANAVITHGGRAILNDVVLRGYVYALGGVFNGTVYAEDGEYKGKVSIADGKIILNKDGSGKLANGNIEWDVDGNVTVRGKYESQIGGSRIAIEPGVSSYDWPTISLYDNSDELLLSIVGMSGVGFTDPKIVMRDPKETSNYAEYRLSSMVINERTANGNFQTFIQAGRIYIAKNNAIVWDINKL